MHSTGSFAWKPEFVSNDANSSIEKLLLTFEKQCEISFKEELYIVRDNGAVLRRGRPLGRRRKLDDVWTFGSLNTHSGYFDMAGHVVHRIVATAFHGPPPSREYVVDHIDTNRQNNRADNLRWVTRLDNILLNPITCARIVQAFGSLEAFFENPSVRTVPSWDWMRTVSKEEAEASRIRLLAWALGGKTSKGGALGEWLYRAAPQIFEKADRNLVSAAEKEAAQESLDTPSPTASAFQRKWQTPTEFPECPAAISSDAMTSYFERLQPGAVFARNRYGESIVSEASIGPDGSLSVVCRNPSGVKHWSHARVFVEGDRFCHESGGTFFELEGAMKAHCIAIGAPYDAYEGSIDDFC